MSDEDEKIETGLPKTPEPEIFLETFSIKHPEKGNASDREGTSVEKED